METKEIDKKEYELSFLVKEEDGAKTVLKFLKELGAEIVAEGPATKIALAYPIEKQQTGYFGFYHFLLEPSEVVHLEHELQTSQEILRHLLLTPPYKKSQARPRPEAGAKAPVAAKVSALKAAEPKQEVLTNEELEKKIEEILG